MVNCSNSFIPLYFWWSRIRPYIRLCGSDHQECWLIWSDITYYVEMFTVFTAWGSVSSVWWCVGNISSSLMSNYCKTDQLRLALTISKHICSMSALWSCGQDILIFTKYHNLMTALKTLTKTQWVLYLKQMDNFLIPSEWQGEEAEEELKGEIFVSV